MAKPGVLNQVAKYKLGLLLGFVIICLGLIGVNQLKKLKGTTQKIIRMQKEVILDEAQFIFKPVMEVNKQNVELKILLDVTSFIHPEIIEFNFKKLVVLSMADQLYSPHQFVVMEQTKDQVLGSLLFDLGPVSPTASFSLNVSVFSDHDIVFN